MFYQQTLEDYTGFSYATFYSSEDVLHIPVDFNDKDHKWIWNKLKTSEKDFYYGRTTHNEREKIRYRLKKVFKQVITVDKYDGMDVFIKLTKEDPKLYLDKDIRLPKMDGIEGKWYKPEFEI